MSGIDDVGRREGDRLRGEAAAVADTEEQLAALRSTMVSAEPGDTHRRAILGVAAAIVLAVQVSQLLESPRAIEHDADEVDSTSLGERDAA